MLDEGGFSGTLAALETAVARKEARLFHIPSVMPTDIGLPDEVAGLRELAYNLWWTWSPRARSLFRRIEPEKWDHYRNPIELMINVDRDRWRVLLAEADFLADYRATMDEWQAYMNGEAGGRFAQAYPERPRDVVAYISTEFGFHECLHIYCGGLGVLSGDHCKAASDLGVPMVAVGILYRQGYFEQSMDPDGRQVHIYPTYDFTRLPIQPIVDEQGEYRTIEIPLGRRTVKARLWKVQVGRVPVVLLDTDQPINPVADRPITGLLYVPGREMRLCQEIVLGAGAVRALHALGITPRVWHLNEGHSAFLTLERVRTLVQEQKAGFDRACDQVRAETVFTTHTPVPAGHEVFSHDLVWKYFEPWCGDVGIPFDRLVTLGSTPGSLESKFSLTSLAVRLSCKVNGVSRLHAQVSSKMLRSHWPGLSEDVQPVRPITNGVHVETWISLLLSGLLDRYGGPGWHERMATPAFVNELVEKIPDAELWQVHQTAKERLLRAMRTSIRRQRARHGCSPDELREVDRLLRQDVLTIGFARRFASYKRADLIFRDMGRLRWLLTRDDMPVQLLFAGKAHPVDREGQDLLRRIYEIAQDPQLRTHIVLIEDYDMRLGRVLVQGCDVWMNTPRRPREASGTSGQKAAINGCINLSVLDGWWEEGYATENGWAINPHNSGGGQDHDDAMSLYHTLEHDVIPLFYRREADGLPRDWVKRMKAAIRTSLYAFSAQRMVWDYVTEVYAPTAAGK